MTQDRRPSNQNRPSVDRDGPTGLRFGMFATCVIRDGADDLKGRPKELYTVLVTFADTGSRDTDKGYPYRATLAKAMGCSTKTVDRASDRLEDIGLLTVKRRKLPNSNENDANCYVLHDGWLIHGTPPPPTTPRQLIARYGHHIPGLDLRSLLGGGGDTGDSTPRDTGDATGGDTGVAQSRDSSPEPFSRAGDAPSARSANDPRQGSTGSSARAKGGSAASGKSRRRLTKAEYAAVHAVLDLLPDALRQALPEKTPTNVTAAVLEALAVGAPYERTAAQLVEYRVMPRWNGHWAAKLFAGELRSAVGPLLAMVKHQPECSDLACEDRVNIHTGGACRSCEVRREDKRADRDVTTETPQPAEPGPMSEQAATVPAQRPACPGCERPLMWATVPELCRECRDEAAYAEGGR